MDRKWIVPAVALIMVVGFLPMAVADHGPWTRSGIAAVSGAGERVNPCTPSSPTNGVINTVYALDSEHADGNHSFLVVPSAYLDVDPTFFDASSGCENLEHGNAPLNFLGGEEAGTVPEGSTHLSIDHFAGAGTFDIDIPNPRCAQSPFC